MYTRYLSAPNHSFFLFGPRGIGKSSWLVDVLPDALQFDLLNESLYLRLLTDPSALAREVEASAKDWIIIDEIQRLPTLLNTVHALIFKSKDSLRFALSGSSARKLKRSDTNLLAGRAITKQMFPLTYAELQGEWDIDSVLRFGTLPKVFKTRKHESEALAINILESYVSTYLDVEIQREAQLRNFEGFTRFLRTAAIMHGQVLNVSRTASDSGIGRTSATGYFDILSDTLVGFRLPAWQPRAKVKEIEHPRYYLFDPGIIRAISGTLRSPLDSGEKGRLLEGYILQELRAYIAYNDLGGELCYWRTADGFEVDLVWRRDTRVIAFEIKSSPRWEQRFLRGFNALRSGVPKLESYGVYLGEYAQKYENVTVLPVAEFLDLLWRGKILS